MLVDKKNKEVKIIDIAVPGDSRLKEKELEKIEKYQISRDEVGHVWQMNKVSVIPVVIGALGVISEKLERHMEKLDVKIAMKMIQKTALLGTARILRKVLSIKRHRRGNFENLGDLLLPARKNKKEQRAYLTMIIIIIYNLNN